jgi:O-antigen chain-terminating methyltransferase
MDKLYRSFEDEFRGSTDDISLRLRKYLPLVIELLPDTNAKILDVGSGRNEWLNLMSDLGYPSLGIEASGEMSKGKDGGKFELIIGDVRTEIKNLNDCSISLVTGFHIVEHLSPEDLVSLLIEINRVLVPGGLLLLETPNPSNLFVGSHSFYLDMTHKNPVPSALLKFLVTKLGFPQSVVVPLHESMPQTEGLSLERVLRGVSQDYALISTKESSNGHTAEEFRQIVEKHLRSHTAPEMPQVANEYDQHLADVLRSLSGRISDIENSRLSAKFKRFLRNHSSFSK